jgi:hypothetical protein
MIASQKSEIVVPQAVINAVLSQDRVDDYVKKLSGRGTSHWIQGDLDFPAMQKACGLDGRQFPLILLIDPHGNIVATGLRGEDIQSTVATALAKK